MRRGSRRAFLAGALSLAAAGRVSAVEPLEEPVLRLAPDGDAPAVALTLDACDGGVDRRVLDALVALSVPATVFVSGKWLSRNPETFRALLERPDLFEIGNHGLHHVAAIDRPMSLWGVPAAGSLAAIATEVTGGAAVLVAAGAPAPAWYRGAAALYTPAALRLIASLGYRVAGYSINADQGASLGAAAVRRRIAAARDGDVLIAHVNQPKRAAGAGVAAGIADLAGAGLRFVRLSDRPVAPSA